MKNPAALPVEPPPPLELSNDIAELPPSPVPSARRRFRDRVDELRTAITIAMIMNAMTAMMTGAGMRILEVVAT